MIYASAFFTLVSLIVAVIGIRKGWAWQVILLNLVAGVTNGALVASWLYYH